jgi:hypothetical protein
MRTMKIRRLCWAEHCSTLELGFFYNGQKSTALSLYICHVGF